MLINLFKGFLSTIVESFSNNDLCKKRFNVIQLCRRESIEIIFKHLIKYNADIFSMGTNTLIDPPRL
jgi:hypothetical protein